MTVGELIKHLEKFPKSLPVKLCYTDTGYDGKTLKPFPNMISDIGSIDKEHWGFGKYCVEISTPGYKESLHADL